MPATPQRISRREAIQRVSTLLGAATFVGGSALLNGCAAYDPAYIHKQQRFTDQDIALLDAVADTILPDTNTPGAKAAGVGRFIAVMVSDAYRIPEQRIFHKGLRSLERTCRRRYGNTFPTITPAQRVELVTELDQEQYQHMRTRTPDTPVHYFRLLKELTLLGYFTSEIGCTQAMRYRETPGRFDPCVPLAPGDTSWAEHA